MKYKIGQILTSYQDVEVEKGLSGEKVIILKGNRIIIGADNLAHHLRDGMIQPLAKGSEVKGYDAAGLSEYIYLALIAFFPLSDMMEDYDVEEKEFREELECALEDIGF